MCFFFFFLLEDEPWSLLLFDLFALADCAELLFAPAASLICAGAAAGAVRPLFGSPTFVPAPAGCPLDAVPAAWPEAPAAG